VVENGVTDYNSYPYHSGDGNVGQCKKNNSKWKISGYNFVENKNYK